MRSLRPIALVTLLATSLHAQAPRTGTFAGRVLGNSAPVPNVEVSLVGYPSRTTTDSLGRFRLTSLPVGTLMFEFRRIGFSLKREIIIMEDGSTVEREITLDSRAAELDTIRTTAQTSSPTGFKSIAMRDFEARRANPNNHGRFVTEEELRKVETLSLVTLLRTKVPGVRFVNYNSGTYLGSQRGRHSINDQWYLNPLDMRSPTGCWGSVYMDGTPMFTRPQMPPDLSRIFISSLGGVEFYPSAALAPSQFRDMNSPCGILLIWSRSR